MLGVENVPEVMDYYPPIYDRQNGGSCVAYSMDMESEILNGEFILNHQIAVAFWFAWRGEYKDAQVNNRIDQEIPGLFEHQTLAMGGHITEIGTRVRNNLDVIGPAVEDLMTMVRLQFSPDSALDCCLDVAREIKKLAEHDEINQKCVSFLFVTSKA